MKLNKSRPERKMDDLTKKILEGFQLAYRRLVEQRRKTNEPLIMYRNGQVVYVDPATIKLDKEK